jgi:hypothetical protein
VIFHPNFNYPYNIFDQRCTKFINLFFNKVSWHESTYQLIHKKYDEKSYHYDIKIPDDIKHNIYYIDLPLYDLFWILRINKVVETYITKTCHVGINGRVLRNYLTMMKEECKSIIVLDLQISSYIEQTLATQVNCLGLVCL